MNTKMDTKLLSPSQLFIQPVRYEIPEFQRRYIWNKDQQWEPLWEDVTDIAENILDKPSFNKKHFLGAVVLQQTTSAGDIQRGSVIDGQQRLTTLQLMMDAVQEVIEKHKHEGESERLRELITNKEHYIEEDPNCKFKVWPTVFDREAYCHSMDDELDSTEFSKSIVVRAHEYFKTQTKSWIDAQSVLEFDGQKIANAIGKAIRLHLQLVVIELGSEDEPHLIFETMNARGTPLLQSDMVKNNILHEAKIYTEKFGGQEPVVRDLWSFGEDHNTYWTQEIGRGSNTRPRIDVFLNHWLTFRTRKLTKQYQEFESFRKYAKTEHEKRHTIYHIAKDLDSIGKTYRCIDDCSIEGIKSITPFLKRCKAMNLGAVIPLLLWLLTNETLNENQKVLKNCIRVLDSFFVRRAICGRHARNYATIGEQLIGLLNQTKQRSDCAVRDELAKRDARGEDWPTDEEFEASFLESPLYQWITRSRLRMVLDALEEQLRSGFAEEECISDKKLEIEHVLPREWDKHWPLPYGLSQNHEAREDRNRMKHTIGNLTLVKPDFNKSLSNQAWCVKKKEIDRHSVLFLNRELVQNAEWDEQMIHERSKSLFQHALKIWPYADKMFEE